MPVVRQLLAANEVYAEGHEPQRVPGAWPTRRLAVITCMDARIDVFAVLGLHLGEAHVLRNAGGRVTDDILRSLALSAHVLGTDTVVLMQHTKCGLAGVTDAQLHDITGAEVHFLPIDDHGDALGEDVDLIASTPYLAPIRRIVGLVYDIESGHAECLIDWRRESQP
jgi:carbonic anhydrase